MNCSSIGCDLGRGMDIHIFFLVLSQSLPPHSLNSVPRSLQRKSISLPKGKPFKYLKTVILASLKSPLMQVKYLQFLPSFLFLFFFFYSLPSQSPSSVNAPVCRWVRRDSKTVQLARSMWNTSREMNLVPPGPQPRLPFPVFTSL